MQPVSELDRLRRRIDRERLARLEAEQIAEKGLRELYEQRRSLELLEAIAAAANSTTSVHDVLQFAITHVCEFKEWPVGHAYLRTRIEDADRLVPTPIWHVSNPERVEAFRRETDTTRFDLGTGLPGRVWESARPAWISNVLEDPNFPRVESARAAGLKAAFAFPVLVGDEVTAVLEFYGDKVAEPDTELLRLMYQIATQLARVIERKRAEEQLLHDASHDPLTGLPNRALFKDRLSHAIARARRKSVYHYAVLFIDLDHFKVVNDSLGHLIGDRLLVAVSERLLATLREGDMVSQPNAVPTPDIDTLARLGGDEFIILLDELRDPDDALIVAARIQEALRQPFYIEERDLYATASIGIASSATGYSTADDVLRDSDLAMYRAKSLGRARSEIYDQTMHETALKRLSVESDLRRALQNDELVLHFQPIIALESGKVSGFEALVRWQRTPETLVYPGDFIQIAEDTGLIMPIGSWVLAEACRALRRWQALPHRAELSMSVNVSARQFAQPGLAANVRRIIDATGIAPATLRLEITETITMGDVKKTIEVLSQLKEIGVGLSIDDFGTGYSSLSYLHRFPLDVLKIDRSFISQMDVGGDGYQIVQTIMALAHTLGMDVVAEGTETAEQIRHLRSLACGYAQGYFYSRPVGAAAAEKLLEGAGFSK